MATIKVDVLLFCGPYSSEFCFYYIFVWHLFVFVIFSSLSMSLLKYKLDLLCTNSYPVFAVLFYAQLSKAEQGRFICSVIQSVEGT